MHTLPLRAGLRPPAALRTQRHGVLLRGRRLRECRVRVRGRQQCHPDLDPVQQLLLQLPGAARTLTTLSLSQSLSLSLSLSRTLSRTLSRSLSLSITLSLTLALTPTLSFLTLTPSSSSSSSPSLLFAPPDFQCLGLARGLLRPLLPLHIFGPLLLRRQLQPGGPGPGGGAGLPGLGAAPSGRSALLAQDVAGKEEALVGWGE